MIARFVAVIAFLACGVRYGNATMWRKTMTISLCSLPPHTFTAQPLLTGSQLSSLESTCHVGRNNIRGRDKKFTKNEVRCQNRTISGVARKVQGNGSTDPLHPPPLGLWAWEHESHGLTWR